MKRPMRGRGRASSKNWAERFQKISDVTAAEELGDSYLLYFWVVILQLEAD